MNEDVAEVPDPMQPLLAALQEAMSLATAIEPAAAGPTKAQVDALAKALDVVTTAVEGLDVGEVGNVLAVVYARCAAVAIAAGDERADRWLRKAEKYAINDDLRAELGTASGHRERYRKLVHGRNLIANGRAAEAVRLWNQLVEAGPEDAITRGAKEMLDAPRPLSDSQMPSLWRYNGFGVGFYGSRDHREDGYTTTHCISALWIPLIPLGAYRVRAEGDGYIVMGRVALSKFARIARLGMVAAIVAVIVGFVLHRHFTDPSRLARIHFDDAIETAEASDPETALRTLDDELGRDLALVDVERAEHAGAMIVKLTAGFVPTPFARTSLDQATRLVRRYQGLPARAQGGEAKTAISGALDNWIVQLGDKPDTADARLALLRHQGTLGVPNIEARIDAARIAVAATKAEDWPLDALAILVDPPARDSIKKADDIVARLVESPALLVDAGGDLDAWLAATTAGALKTAVESQRALAQESQTQATTESLTAKQLADMLKQRPWDQFVVLRQAQEDARTGKLADAAKRLAAIGKPGMMIRDARLVLGQLWLEQGKLEDADVLLTSLLGPRLDRFVAASGKLAEVASAAQKRIERELTAGTVPQDLQRKYQAAVNDEARDELISEYIRAEMTGDKNIEAARKAYEAVGDVVPVCLAAGTVKLRRAQAMPDGPARSAMLVEAERTFLAIRNEAEGQPDFKIGLGEIYARLGKAKESEAEFKALLDKHDPELSIRVARTYRSIGSVDRAKTVAKDVYDDASSPANDKGHAAIMLGLLTAGYDEDESESWFRKADQKDPFVRTSLLEIEGFRLRRQGKWAECGAKFAQAAKEHLAQASATANEGYNNAAVAYQEQFACTGAMQSLADAAAVLEKAYRASHESAIVVGNYALLLIHNGRLHVLGKRIDLRLLQPGAGETDSLLSALLDSPERDAVLADLAADPDIRRGEQVFAEFEVLAPNNTLPYVTRFEWATERRDVAAATAIVERARKATALDTSQEKRTRERWKNGDLDKEQLDTSNARLARLEAVGGDPKTHAAARFLIAGLATKNGVFRGDPALLRKGREAAIEAMKAWPSLSTSGKIMWSLIDEAGLAADAKTWIAGRRDRSAVALLATNDALAKAVRSSPQWGQLLGYARADTSRAGVDDLRLARMLGDAALETRSKAVLDDKLAHLATELELVTEPSDPSAKEDLDYLDRR